jgi:hypothetical protein
MTPPTAEQLDRLADEVRYANGNGTSDYWRGFNDGIDKLVEHAAPALISELREARDTLAHERDKWDHLSERAINADHQLAEAREREARLRYIAWDACPHDGKYGDDGEMQCRGADFLRWEPSLLQEHVRRALTDFRPEERT